MKKLFAGEKKLITIPLAFMLGIILITAFTNSSPTKPVSQQQITNPNSTQNSINSIDEKPSSTFTETVQVTPAPTPTPTFIPQLNQLPNLQL